jgi:hypothetical protein
MRFFSRLDRGKAVTANEAGTRDEERVATYQSVLSVPSKTFEGVTFAVKRISFGRRMELARRIRELSRRAEFLGAGTELEEKIEASLLSQEIEATYLRWALVNIEGLAIDGEPATAEQLLEKGPEELTQEIVSAIKGLCGLSEAERKN